MAKKKVKNKIPSKKYSRYTVSGDKLERKAHCPKCGPGVFLAEHKNRKTCGKCGYTQFQSKEPKVAEKPVKEEKPVQEAPKAEEKPTEEAKAEAQKDNAVKESS